MAQLPHKDPQIVRLALDLGETRHECYVVLFNGLHVLVFGHVYNPWIIARCALAVAVSAQDHERDEPRGAKRDEQPDSQSSDEFHLVLPVDNNREVAPLREREGGLVGPKWSLNPATDASLTPGPILTASHVEEKTGR